MTTGKLESLKYLLVLVEAAKAEEDDFLNMPKDPLEGTQEFGYNVTHISAWKAYNGSMDAMKALARALTPGRGWRKNDQFTRDGGFQFSTFWSTDPGKSDSGQICEYKNYNDARAWLICTLKVLIFDEEKKLQRTPS